jgi:hypothetical protein
MEGGREGGRERQSEVKFCARPQAQWRCKLRGNTCYRDGDEEPVRGRRPGPPVMD